MILIWFLAIFSQSSLSQKPENWYDLPFKSNKKKKTRLYLLNFIIFKTRGSESQLESIIKPSMDNVGYFVNECGDPPFFAFLLRVDHYLWLQYKKL